MNFDNVLIRCSAIGQIMTAPQKKEDKEAGLLGTTHKSYLAKLYREVKYNRSQEFETKYTEKGKRGEENAITLLARYKKKFLKKNDQRIQNDFLSGEPDLYIGTDIYHAEEGFDTKCPWSLWTFPYETEKLDKDYEYQNHGYMALTGAKRWTTAYCLVNADAQQIIKEKERLYYALGCPDDSNMKYMERLIEIEKNMIFDLAQFKTDNPGYDLDCKDWNYDIPMSERIKEIVTERDDVMIERIYLQVRRSRQYMNETYGELKTAV